MHIFFSLSLRLALAYPRQEQWTLDSGHEALVKTSWLQGLCTVCMKPGMWIWVHVNVREDTHRGIISPRPHTVTTTIYYQ